MKIDMHIHTKYSGHSLLKLKTIEKICRKKSLKVAITDHNTIRGAIKLKQSFEIIVGEEIMTDQGEIVGLFLNEEIQPTTLEETITAIKDQDGIVYIPHPFDRLRKASITDDDFIKYADIVEVFNSRCLYGEDNEKARRLVKENHLLGGAGSDAHTQFEIGNAYVEMDDFGSKNEFLNNLRVGKPYGKRSPVWVHGITKALKVVR